jgi:hypothetical protein
MSRKNCFILVAVATLGVSGFFVAKALAAVDPYAPASAPTATVTAPVRPPVRDPLRPPARSPFLP